MKRACAVKPAGTWRAVAFDRVVLGADDRHRRRVVLTAERGTQFLLDLPRPVALRHGDGLVLDDGTIVAVAGEQEPLSEIDPGMAGSIVRLAWHLGNRHAEMQIAEGRLRIRCDHVLEDMVRSFGASVTPIAAPFEPLRNA
jgi:urease accessory protein